MSLATPIIDAFTNTARQAKIIDLLTTTRRVFHNTVTQQKFITLNVLPDTSKVSSHVTSSKAAILDMLGNSHIDVAIPSSYLIELYARLTDKLLENTTASFVQVPLNWGASSTLDNVHTVLKSPFRQILGKMRITYENALVDETMSFTTSGEAHGSDIDQVLQKRIVPTKQYFSLYSNNLSGAYTPIADDAEVGWISNSLSDSAGNFATPVFFRFDLQARLITAFTITGDIAKNNVLVDFTVRFLSGSTWVEHPVTGNEHITLTLSLSPIPDVSAIEIVVSKVSLPNFPAIISSIPVRSVVNYSSSDLISIDLLEELSYLDDSAPLGGISANMLTAVLSNASGEFYFNNSLSMVANQLKKNRKVEAWLGVVLKAGIEEWFKLGVFWSYQWEVPVGTLTTKVVALDTIGLIATFTFYRHQVYTNKSIGELISIILEDAKLTLPQLVYSIEPALYDIVIPTAWFAYASHMAALNKLAACYPVNIYCDRDGVIRSEIQPLQVSSWYDSWSNSTNVVDTTYPTLYTNQPNILQCSITNINTRSDTALNITEAFTVSAGIHEFAFTYPSSDVSVIIEGTATVTYEVYSWGLRLNVTTAGTITKLLCTGTVLEVILSGTITKSNQVAILQDGPIKKDLTSDFVQNHQMAEDLINFVYEAVSGDKYDAEVNYRGDISIAISDPIKLLDGIAPTDLYTLKRHELFWDGSLTGSALLST